MRIAPGGARRRRPRARRRRDVCASGFSTKQCLPASSTRTASSAWVGTGVARTTASSVRVGEQVVEVGRPPRAPGCARADALERVAGRRRTARRARSRRARRSCARGSGPSSRGPATPTRSWSRAPSYERAPPRPARPARPSPYSGGRSAGGVRASAATRRVGVEVDEHVPARVDRLRPLRRRAQRHARDAGEVRLLLHAARVGEHRARVAQQRGEVEVAERRREPDAGAERARAGPRRRAARAVRGCSGSTTGPGTAAQQRHERARAARGRRRCRRGARWPARSRRARRRPPRAPRSAPRRAARAAARRRPSRRRPPRSRPRRARRAGSPPAPRTSTAAGRSRGR